VRRPPPLRPLSKELFNEKEQWKWHGVFLKKVQEVDGSSGSGGGGSGKQKDDANSLAKLKQSDCNKLIKTMLSDKGHFPADESELQEMFVKVCVCAYVFFCF
jgi:hypothetical protein